jgi:hypothetical protein
MIAGMSPGEPAVVAFDSIDVAAECHGQLE